MASHQAGAGSNPPLGAPQDALENAALHLLSLFSAPQKQVPAPNGSYRDPFLPYHACLYQQEQLGLILPGSTDLAGQSFDGDVWAGAAHGVPSSWVQAPAFQLAVAAPQPAAGAAPAERVVQPAFAQHAAREASPAVHSDAGAAPATAVALGRAVDVANPWAAVPLPPRQYQVQLQLAVPAQQALYAQLQLQQGHAAGGDYQQEVSTEMQQGLSAEAGRMVEETPLVLTAEDVLLAAPNEVEGAHMVNADLASPGQEAQAAPGEKVAQQLQEAAAAQQEAAASQQEVAAQQHGQEQGQQKTKQLPMPRLRLVGAVEEGQLSEAAVLPSSPLALSAQHEAARHTEPTNSMQELERILYIAAGTHKANSGGQGPDGLAGLAPWLYAEEQAKGGQVQGADARQGDAPGPLLLPPVSPPTVQRPGAPDSLQTQHEHHEEPGTSMAPPPAEPAQEAEPASPGATRGPQADHHQAAAAAAAAGAAQAKPTSLKERVASQPKRRLQRLQWARQRPVAVLPATTPVGAQQEQQPPAAAVAPLAQDRARSNAAGARAEEAAPQASGPRGQQQAAQAAAQPVLTEPAATELLCAAATEPAADAELVPEARPNPAAAAEPAAQAAAAPLLLLLPCKGAAAAAPKQGGTGPVAGEAPAGLATEASQPPRIMLSGEMTNGQRRSNVAARMFFLAGGDSFPKAVSLQQGLGNQLCFYKERAPGSSSLAASQSTLVSVASPAWSSPRAALPLRRQRDWAGTAAAAQEAARIAAAQQKQQEARAKASAAAAPGGAGTALAAPAGGVAKPAGAAAAPAVGAFGVEVGIAARMFFYKDDQDEVSSKPAGDSSAMPGREAEGAPTVNIKQEPRTEAEGFQQGPAGVQETAYIDLTAGPPASAATAAAAAAQAEEVAAAAAGPGSGAAAAAEERRPVAAPEAAAEAAVPAVGGAPAAAAAAGPADIDDDMTVTDSRADMELWALHHPAVDVAQPSVEPSNVRGTMRGRGRCCCQGHGRGQVDGRGNGNSSWRGSGGGRGRGRSGSKSGTAKPTPLPLIGPDGQVIKRKRGRPRKHPLPEDQQGEAVPVAKWARLLAVEGADASSQLPLLPGAAGARLAGISPEPTPMLLNGALPAMGGGMLGGGVQAMDKIPTGFVPTGPLLCANNASSLPAAAPPQLLPQPAQLPVWDFGNIAMQQQHPASPPPQELMRQRLGSVHHPHNPGRAFEMGGLPLRASALPAAAAAPTGTLPLLVSSPVGTSLPMEAADGGRPAAMAPVLDNSPDTQTALGPLSLLPSAEAPPLLSAVGGPAAVAAAEAGQFSGWALPQRAYSPCGGAGLPRGMGAGSRPDSAWGAAIQKAGAPSTGALAGVGLSGQGEAVALDWLPTLPSL